MAEERSEQPFRPDEVVARLRERANEQGPANDLSAFELELPTERERVRFRPELGFSSKPVIGRPITGVKRLLLRLQLYVFDDLARQADEAIQGVERRLEVEIATRERLEGEVRALEARIGELEDAGRQRRAR